MVIDMGEARAKSLNASLRKPIHALDQLPSPPLKTARSNAEWAKCSITNLQRDLEDRLYGTSSLSHNTKCRGVIVIWTSMEGLREVES